MLQLQRVNNIFLTSDPNVLLVGRPRNCCSGNNSIVPGKQDTQRYEHKSNKTK